MGVAFPRREAYGLCPAFMFGTEPISDLYKRKIRRLHRIQNQMDLAPAVEITLAVNHLAHDLYCFIHG